MTGYIKLFRQIKEWEWYAVPPTRDVFLHLLLSCNFTESRLKGQVIPAGTVLTTIKQLAEDLGFSAQKIRTALKHLEATGEISKKSTSGGTLIVVENWQKYQGGDAHANKPATNNQQTINKQSTNLLLYENIRIKEYKNICKDCANFNILPEEVKEKINEYLQMRDRIGKPVVAKSTIEGLISTLDKLARGDGDKRRIIQQSIDHCWLDFYPLKGQEVKAPSMQLYKPEKKEDGLPPEETSRRAKEITDRLKDIF